MSRLASFRGPSAPSASPVVHNQQSPSQKKRSQRSDQRLDSFNAPPPSPSRSTESTYHRKTRALLHELKSIASTWDDLVLIDGVRAARSLVDTRTELENTLALIPDRQPHYHIVGPKLAFMEQKVTELDIIVSKLVKLFRRMNTVVDGLETLYFESTKSKGYQWARDEPLWATWSLEKFVTSVPSILPLYHRSLHTHIDIVNTLRSHAVTFEASRDAINKWAEQSWLEELGWQAYWEDLCAAEVEKWDG